LRNLKACSASIVRFAPKPAQIGALELNDRLRVSWSRLSLGLCSGVTDAAGGLLRAACMGGGFIFVTPDSAVRWDRCLFPEDCAGHGRKRHLRVSEITKEDCSLGRSRQITSTWERFDKDCADRCTCLLLHTIIMPYSADLTQHEGKLLFHASRRFANLAEPVN
jgi:hypothetical protein